MKNGTFHYVNYVGVRSQIRVRECPDPVKVRAALIELLSTPVYFQEAK